MKKVFIVLKEDVMLYPPVLTILNILSSLKVQVSLIGVYTDKEGKAKYESKGVKFIDVDSYYENDSLLTKLKKQLKFRRIVKKTLEESELTNEDRVWIMGSESICLLSSIVDKYPTILHFFEFVESKINWKYQLLNPSYNPENTLKKALKVVCCEYNRAQITKGIYQLKDLPLVLPNKVIVDESELSKVPMDIKPMIDDITQKTKGKKVVLYQGIFLDEERRLEEFCEAISHLPDDYAFIAMGKGSKMYEHLKAKYESDRIIFIPFIRPPYHLLVTKLATVGVLSYFPRRGPIAYTINPIYCAPNKIFEYAKFGIPMISNDIPALKYVYMEYGCGECIKYPMTTENITEVIKKVMDNLPTYREGALKYFDSVNVKSIISEIIE